MKLRTSSNSGFTLLEIMVVVFLIALTVGIVSINFRHDSSQIVETEARRFVALVDQMCQESITQGRVFALTDAGATAYTFVVLDNAEWQAVRQDDIFRQRQLPEGISLNLYVDDTVPGEDAAYLRCEPDGFMTPFSAEFDFDGVRYRVHTNEMRKMEISAVQ
ncbi:MAG: prepilin-type N-terminal cleavage/methylation domain-containing protein [Pseudomonadota bacterium]|nr:prepilin-type N-terminal cleavage/methylation domain-containing protein [Pseudomonadota bacterium]